MTLVSSVLAGSNYLVWSISKKITLAAKVKLGFVNSKYACPNEDSLDYGQRVRVDCKVTSWIVNSIVKDIPEAFSYTSTVKEL